MKALQIPTPRIYRLTDKNGAGGYKTTETTQAIPFAEDPRFIVAFHPIHNNYAVYLDVVGTKFSPHSCNSIDEAIDEFNAYRMREGDRVEKYIRINWAIFMSKAVV